MGATTGISWTDSTWNPITGCTRVSEACRFCYIDWAPPFRIEGRHFVDASGERSNEIGSATDLRLHPDRLTQPLRWGKPRKIFVNSLSDLFHEDVPDEYIAKVFAVMALSPSHTFQVLTKRHGRMRALLSKRRFRVMVEAASTHDFDRYVPPDDEFWPLSNVWLGTTVENQTWADRRIPALLETPAAVRFISVEPMLGPVDFTQYATGLDWVIVGGESGTQARPMYPDWARSVREQCVEHNIPLWFKQWGEWAETSHPAYEERHPTTIVDAAGEQWDASNIEDSSHPSTVMARIGKHRTGDLLDGKQWHQFPPAEVHANA